jgi:hypothetical protein
MNVLDQLHWTYGTFPVADLWDDGAGAVTTDIVNCESAVGVFYLIMRGNCDAGTGTALFIAQACSTAAAAATTDVPFWYRESTTLDTWGVWTHVAATGWTCTAGDNTMIQIFVPAGELSAAGYAYCRLSMTEPVDDPCVGSIATAVVQTRYQHVPATLLT